MAIFSLNLPKFLLIVSTITFYSNPISAARNLNPKTNTEFIKSSCSTTTYPKLCYTSLSTHANKIQESPKLLANAALNVTLQSTKSTSTNMVKLSKGHGLKPREVAAMQDCVEELSKSIAEMGRPNGPNFRVMMSDIQTWVSAAMTDESTCLDGFSGQMMNGKLKSDVRGQIVNIAHLTSNALALVNNYASLHG